jgi:regulator of RNase E activity RraA
MAALKTSVYATLKKYGACDVADALVKLGNPDGGYIAHLVKQSDLDGPTVVGPAYTVQYAPMNDPRPAVQNHYIDQAPRDGVIVISTPKELQMDSAPYTKVTNALYGGLMSTRAKYLGCAGTVVLGKIRDIDEQQRLSYPVFSYGLGIAPPNKAMKVVAVNEPLETLWGTIHPQDLVVADTNGVAIIPHSLINEVAEYVPKRVEADSRAAQDIEQGIPAATAQKTRRQGL